jgi:hypothetical protein
MIISEGKEPTRCVKVCSNINCTPDDGHIGAPKHVEAIKTAYFVASSWFFTFHYV